MTQASALQQSFQVDSAGILDYHEGELPDKRMRSVAQRRGYTLTHRARQITLEDFHRFDHIVAMDREILKTLKDFASHEGLTSYHAQLSLFLDHLEVGPKGQDVPDPYWSGEEGFEHVLDLIESGCEALLRKLNGGGDEPC